MAWLSDGRRGVKIMNFYIQVSNPRYNEVFNSEDIQLSDAIESIFPMNTENAFLVWNHIYIPLSYKYDLSYMIVDINKLIYSIMNNESGKLYISWLPDTFRTDWNVEWNSEYVCIISHWDYTIGHLESLLNKNNRINIRKTDFINEWKELICILIRGLIKCGYDKENLVGMEDMIILYESIDGCGLLYE